MARRQDHRLAADLSGQLAEGDHRARERHRADQDTEIGLDVVDGQLDAFEVRRRVHEVREADEDSRETDQAVQNGNKLGHLGHLHATREDEADTAAGEQCQHQLDIVLRHDTKDGREQRDRHTDDAVPVAASCGLLVREATQREDEKNRRGDV